MIKEVQGLAWAWGGGNFGRVGVKGLSFFREGEGGRGVLGSKTGPLLLGPGTFTLTSFDFLGVPLICMICVCVLLLCQWFVLIFCCFP